MSETLSPDSQEIIIDIDIWRRLDSIARDDELSWSDVIRRVMKDAGVWKDYD